MTPSIFGKRLVPQLVDQLAQSEPEAVWTGAPVDDEDLSKGYKYYNFRQLANAVNWFAHHLDQQLGKPSRSFETITYIGPNDVRYIVVVLAAIKTGRKALLVSTRNSLEAQINLFDKTDSSVAIHASSFADTIATWQKKRPMKAVAIPAVDEMLNVDGAAAYPYTKTWEEARFDPFVVLHTSGSTGFPKPIDVKTGLMSITDAYQDLPDFDGRPFWMTFFARESKSMFIPMPLFHAAGLYMMVGFAIFYRRPVVLPPPSKPVSADVVEGSIRSSGADGAFMAPSILEELNDDENAVKLLASLKFVGTGSGNVATSVGNHLVESGVCLNNLLSSTEHSPYPMFQQDPKDWAYFCIQDEPCGFEWRDVGDEVYELFVVRKDKNDPGLQACFYTFPDLQEWSTRDLYKKHPTRPGCWIYYGRADNVIVFANGEKLNPVSIEDEVTGHPKVKSALVVGRDRLQPALFIEPIKYPESRAEAQALLDDVWPWVARTNANTVAHGQVHRPYIALTPRGKGFPRSGKGMIQRAMAETMYQNDIDRLYESASQAQMKNSTKLDMTSVTTLTESLQQVVNAQLQLDVITADTDFFSAGLDSLKAMAVSRVLTGGIKQIVQDGLDASLASPRGLYRALYQNPTPRRLATFILTKLNRPVEEESAPVKVDAVRAMVEKYIDGLPSVETLYPPSPPVTSNMTVVLTGSTGSIGSYVLDQLNNNPVVGKVIALNRGPDPRARQVKSNASRGLSTEFPKTTFLTADLSQPRLGLTLADYQMVLHEADAILHNQWQVNFNLSIASFEPHIRGVRQLVDLSTASAKRPRIVFVTTIAEVAGWTPNDGSDRIPESPLPGHTVPGEQGYGAGKLAASLILEAAGKISGVPVATVRVGQVAGPVDRPQGSWNRWEWFPSIVASSVHLRCLPETIGASKDMDMAAWVPVEREAELLVDVTLSRDTGYFHGVNPHSASYTDDILPILKETLKSQIDEVVSYPEWIARLAASESSTQTNEEIEKNPGVKLLGFYQSLALTKGKDVMALQWDTAKSEGVSKTWQDLVPVQHEWMNLWVQQWGLC